jgi:hypothetical protein
VIYAYSGANDERVDETVDFPASQETIDQLLRNAGIDGVHERMFFAAAYESKIEGLIDAVDSIEAKTNGVSPDEMNTIAKSVQSLDSDGRERFAALLVFERPSFSVESLIDLAESCASGDTEICAFIVNAGKYDEGNSVGIIVPLPATKESIQALMGEIELDGKRYWEYFISDYVTAIRGLDKRLPLSDVTIDELNYLAAKIKNLTGDDRDVFSAAIESNRHCSGIVDLINLTDNLGCFSLQPAFGAKHYGEFLIDESRAATSDLMEWLADSQEAGAQFLILHVERLEENVDLESLGLAVAKDEYGSFTETGYITEHKVFQESYHEAEDIPHEYRVFAYPKPKAPMRVENVDIPVLLCEMLAVTGEHSHRESNRLAVTISSNKTDYLFLFDGRNAVLAETAEAYHRGSPEYDFWILCGDNRKARAFAIHTKDFVGGTVVGDIAEIDTVKQKADIIKNAADAEIDIALSASLFTNTRAVSSKELLADLGKPFMAQAKFPQPEFIRIGCYAAEEIMAREDSDVYKLFPEGPKRLSAMQAIRSKLKSPYRSEYAVKPEELYGLEKWAKREVESVRRALEKIKNSPDIER